MKPKQIFAPIPGRAVRDTTLSGLAYRVLGVIAMYDRFGKNGQGCWISNHKIAELAGCTYPRVSMMLADLKRRGYITSDRQPRNRRHLIHTVIYNVDDAFQNQKPDPDSYPNGEGSSLDSSPNSSPPFQNSASRIKNIEPTRDRKDIPRSGERDSGEPARPKGRGDAPSMPSETDGAILARLEKKLQAGDKSVYTEECREWLENLAEDHSTGDPDSGRAHRLLEDYFP